MHFISAGREPLYLVRIPSRDQIEQGVCTTTHACASRITTYSGPSVRRNATALLLAARGATTSLLPVIVLVGQAPVACSIRVEVRPGQLTRIRVPAPEEPDEQAKTSAIHRRQFTLHRVCSTEGATRPAWMRALTKTRRCRLPRWSPRRTTVPSWPRISGASCATGFR